MRKSPILALPALAFSLGFQPPARATDCRHLPRPVATCAAPNDNRASAGVLSGGVLTVRLAVRPAAWYPDGRDGCGLTEWRLIAKDGADLAPQPLRRARLFPGVGETMAAAAPRSLCAIR
jgi:hypothetical protein